MDASVFDTRRYPTVSAAEGYGAWAARYDEDVDDALDRRLLDRVRSVDWPSVGAAADLACGTGRVGGWLRHRGAGEVDGLDLTPAMLDRARARGVYRRLVPGDVTATPFETSAYDLAIMSLADEHLPDLTPLYREAARITRPGGRFVLVGYHPFFLLNGLLTHFHDGTGEARTIRSYVHLFGDHVTAATAAGLTLGELHEGRIDDDWLAAKPKWARYLHWPVSFAAVWTKPGAR